MIALSSYQWNIGAIKMHGAAFPSFVSKSRMQSKSSQVNTGWTQTRLSLAWLDISSLAKPPHTTSSVVSRWQEATVNRQPTGKSDSCNPLGLFICWNLHGIYVCDSSKLLKTEVCQGGTPSPSPVQWITSATTDRRLNLQGHLSTTVHARQFLPKFHRFPSIGVQHYLDEKMSFWFPSICRNQISIHLHFRYI